MRAFVAASPIVNCHHPAVHALARELRADFEDVTIIARRCFEWVRDEIQHSGDFELNPVTCTASDVLEQRSGFCYAKSHPLAALLRANGIPAGFCYQRLRAEEHGLDFCLHGPSDVYHPSAMS